MKSLSLNIIAGSLAGLLIVGAASAADVPSSLQPAVTETKTVTAQASGVQIYACSNTAAQPNTFIWVFTAPEADLFDSAGNKIGRHYAGPTWEAKDGSKVVGELKARDPGPDAKAIPWFLLTAKSNSGTGAFGNTRSIQRINTSGGVAPADGCTQAQAGAVVRVPYKATYVFYDGKP